MKMVMVVISMWVSVGLTSVFAQQTTLNWTHIYTQEHDEIIITKFSAPSDSVLLKYECWPKETEYLELRSRALNNGFLKDSSYIICPEKVKITAQTADSAYIEYVPQKMLRKLTAKEEPNWFKGDLD